MSSNTKALDFFTKQGLGDVHHFSDPDCTLYRAFGLARAPFWVILQPRMWLRAIQCMRVGHKVTWPTGDIFRMPGLFLVDKGKVVASYRHRDFDDRPDYLGFALT